MDIKNITILGAGNVATHLGKALDAAGYKINQIYSRTEESALKLAKLVDAKPIYAINQLNTTSDLYIIALTDQALVELAESILSKVSDKIVVHTSGSTSLDILNLNKEQKCGVLYPMQTFSKEKDIDFNNVHFFIEANDLETLSTLRQFLKPLTLHIHEADSQQRRILHLSAVFVCNFTNHMYTIADDLLTRNNLPFDAIFSLIKETTEKVLVMQPQKAQTGPAVRGDIDVINRHLAMLSANSDVQEIYRKISNNIKKYNSK